MSHAPKFVPHQIIRCFLSRNIPLMARAFTTFVRPTLEYASTTWSPSKITQILFLEKVQQNFTKRLPGLKNTPYSERLKIVNLQSLEHRRLINDLTETFKIINNLSSLKFDDFFSFPSYASTRGHSFRLAVPFAATNVRKHFFHAALFQFGTLCQMLLFPQNQYTLLKDLYEA